MEKIVFYTTLLISIALSFTSSMVAEKEHFEYYRLGRKKKPIVWKGLWGLAFIFWLVNTLIGNAFWWHIF